MRLRKQTAYAMEALIFLARQPQGTAWTVGEIAAACDLPADYLAKIFQRLTRHGIVRSFRGRHRGYALALRPSQIPLYSILEALEGPRFLDRCVFWDRLCADIAPCRLHLIWKQVQPTLVQWMKQTTLEDLLSPTLRPSPDLQRGGESVHADSS